MARYICQGHFKDGAGRVVGSGTVSVYLANSTTVASVYEAYTGGTAVNLVTSDSVTGKFLFYVDDGDYSLSQRFKIVLSKTNLSTQTYDYIRLFINADSTEVTIAAIAGKYLDDLFDGGYDIHIKPERITASVASIAGTTFPYQLVAPARNIASFESNVAGEDVCIRVLSNASNSSSNLWLYLLSQGMSGAISYGNVGSNPEMSFGVGTGDYSGGPEDEIWKCNTGTKIKLVISSTAGQIFARTNGWGFGGEPTGTGLNWELNTTTGAVVVSRVTTTQKNALTAVNGMVVYDSTLNKFQGYENGSWTSLI